ncbi:zinc finger, C3HC4 type, domain containing protein [Musa troglodytarum]|uniref:Zinc finger, C3HC4 type, domain containing protein n=1 Tax=Musa troglodytarum TaxID=320322 RepID=A0A9E7HQ34_9LILI|nr:zinc finger, C3HC4 type, domain containing protein [Musa troglodytarum]
MSTLGPSRRGTRRHAREGISRKMVLNLDLNSPPVECQLPEGTSGCRQPRISRGTSMSVDPQPGNPTGRQQGSSAPSNDCLNGGLIDVELIEDEVVILSSPRGFPLRRNHCRRNQPVTVVLDEDPETNLRRSGEQVVRSFLNTHNKRYKSSTSTTVTNCDLYLGLEEDYNSKRKNMMKSKPEPAEVVRKEPAFTCPVCMDALVEAASTICGHIFCLKCIKASIQAQKKCPTCRRKLTKNNFHRVYLPLSD